MLCTIWPTVGWVCPCLSILMFIIRADILRFNCVIRSRMDGAAWWRFGSHSLILTFQRKWKELLKKCKRLSRLAVLENFRAKHHNAHHLGQIPKAVTGAACPTLAQPQLTEMDSPEWNETHKAPCTPRQRLYQTKINERQHSLWAPRLQRQIQYLGGLWESLIGLGCVCVRLASFNQVSQQQTLGVKWCVSGSEAFQAGQKVGEAVGLWAQPSHSVNASQFSSRAQRAFALPAVKLADREPLKSPH